MTEIGNKRMLQSTFQKTFTENTLPRIPACRTGEIFPQMRKAYDERKLENWIHKFGPQTNGWLEHDQNLQRICKEFTSGSSSGSGQSWWE
jgi:hypothetical protein